MRAPERAKEMVMARAFAIFALSSTLLVVGSAMADDRAECAKAAGDEAITACNRIIAGPNPGSVAPYAFYNRGLAHQLKDALDAALADFNEAIRLDPKFAAAYTSRGTIRWQRGKTDQA